MKILHKKKSNSKRYEVQLFGYSGQYCGRIEFHRFLSAWLYMWMNNDLCSTAIMVDKETKKEYSW